MLRFVGLFSALVVLSQAPRPGPGEARPREPVRTQAASKAASLTCWELVEKGVLGQPRKAYCATRVFSPTELNSKESALLERLVNGMDSGLPFAIRSLVETCGGQLFSPAAGFPICQDGVVKNTNECIRRELAVPAVREAVERALLKGWPSPEQFNALADLLARRGGLTAGDTPALRACFDQKFYRQPW